MGDVIYPICYGYWNSYPHLYYICAFIVSSITPSHLIWCIYRCELLLENRIAFIMQNILIFFPIVVLQMPFGFIILLIVMVYLTIYLLDISHVILWEYIQKW